MLSDYYTELNIISLIVLVFMIWRALNRGPLFGIKGGPHLHKWSMFKYYKGIKDYPYGQEAMEMKETQCLKCGKVRVSRAYDESQGV